MKSPSSGDRKSRSWRRIKTVHARKWRCLTFRNLDRFNRRNRSCLDPPSFSAGLNWATEFNLNIWLFKPCCVCGRGWCMVHLATLGISSNTLNVREWCESQCEGWCVSSVLEQNYLYQISSKCISEWLRKFRSASFCTNFQFVQESPVQIWMVQHERLRG